MLCRVFPGCVSTCFQEFNSIAEWISHIDSVKSLKRFVRHGRKPSSLATCHQFCEPSDEQRRVCLSGRMELWIYTEVKPQSAAPEPCSSPRSKILRLLFLG